MTIHGRVLVTGGAGFIGHRLVEHLLATTSCDVVSLDKLDVAGTLFRLSEVLDAMPEARKRFKHVWHDLRAPLGPYAVKEIGKVDYIFHLAAASHVDRSIRYPVDFAYDNVIGTANLLEYAREAKPKLFLFFSTDEVYGNAPDGVSFHEESPHRAGNPYSATKAAAEQLVYAWANTYGLAAIITSTMNVLGVRQHPEKFVPMTIANVATGRPVKIHVHEKTFAPGVRQYVAAEDVAAAVLFVGEHGASGERYNVIGEEMDNLAVANRIAEVVGKPLCWDAVPSDPARPGKDWRYSLSGKKLEALGWTPKRSIDEYIAELVRWSLDNRRWLLL